MAVFLPHVWELTRFLFNQSRRDIFLAHAYEISGQESYHKYQKKFQVINIWTVFLDSVADFFIKIFFLDSFEKFRDIQRKING